MRKREAYFLLEKIILFRKVYNIEQKKKLSAKFRIKSRRRRGLSLEPPVLLSFALAKCSVPLQIPPYVKQGPSDLIRKLVVKEPCMRCGICFVRAPLQLMLSGCPLLEC